MEWYISDPVIREHLLTCEGLVMSASYYDMEFGVMEIYDAEVQVVVQGGEVKMTASDIETHELTAELAVACGFYDSVDDFLESNADFIK